MGRGKWYVPVHWYCNFCSGLFRAKRNDQFLVTLTYNKNVSFCTGTPCTVHAFMIILSLENWSYRALMCVCLWAFNLRLSYTCVRCAAQVWSGVRFPAEWSLRHTLSHRGGREKNRRKEWNREKGSLMLLFISQRIEHLYCTWLHQQEY